MADDSDAVVAARIDLLDYLRQRGLLFPGMDERNHEPHALIDALIAAVRADEHAKLHTLITTVGALTDADVDAFLAAVDEQDPERVERIRKLFNEKLSLGQAWVTKVTSEPDAE